MSSAELWEAVKVIGAALAVLLIGLSGFFTGKKKGPSTEQTEVVAATFAERGLMEQLTRALGEVVAAVRASTAQTAKLNRLLEADAQRRHDEAVVRQALKDRGIVE